MEWCHVWLEYDICRSSHHYFQSGKNRKWSAKGSASIKSFKPQKLWIPEENSLKENTKNPSLLTIILYDKSLKCKLSSLILLKEMLKNSKIFLEQSDDKE